MVTASEAGPGHRDARDPETKDALDQRMKELQPLEELFRRRTLIVHQRHLGFGNLYQYNGAVAIAGA